MAPEKERKAEKCEVRFRPGINPLWRNRVESVGAVNRSLLRAAVCPVFSKAENRGFSSSPTSCLASVGCLDYIGQNASGRVYERTVPDVVGARVSGIRVLGS